MKADIRRRIEALEAKVGVKEDFNPYMEMSGEDLCEVFNEMVRQDEGIQNPTYDDRMRWQRKFDADPDQYIDAIHAAAERMPSWPKQKLTQRKLTT